MKIIKTSQYHEQENSQRKQLALKLLDWHGGQWSPLYSVGSSWLAGRDVPSDVIQEAIQELEDIAQKKVNYPETVTEQNISEVRMLQEELKQNLSNNKMAQIMGDPVQTPNLLDGKNAVQARKIVNKIIEPLNNKRLSDEAWNGVNAIWKALGDNNIDFVLTEPAQYQKDPTSGELTGKTWKFKIDYTNNNRKPASIYGQVIASGVGPVNDPLSTYEILAYVS